MSVEHILGIVGGTLAEFAHYRTFHDWSGVDEGSRMHCERHVGSQHRQARTTNERSTSGQRWIVHVGCMVFAQHLSNRCTTSSAFIRQVNVCFVTIGFRLKYIVLKLTLKNLLFVEIRRILYGVSSLALVVTYPLMKRITYWPQLFLGLTFNWGAMLGWSAIHLGAIDWTVIGPLYLAGIFWTLIYDTIYAYQDFNYDKKVGIKSTAIRFGKQPKVWLSAFSTAMIANFLVVGIMADQTWPYYVALGLSTTRLAEIVYNLDINNAQDCGRRFRQNQQIGMIMLVGIIVGTLFKPKTSTTTLPAEEHSIQQSLLEKHPHVI